MKHEIHKAMAGLALSQNLMDKFNAPAPQEQPQEMAQPQLEMAQAQETPKEASQVQVQSNQQKTPSDGVGGLEKAGQMIMSAFSQIKDTVLQTEKKQEETVKSLEEKHTEELKGIKDALKQVIES